MHVKYPGSDSSHRKNLALQWRTQKGAGSLIVNEPRTIALLDHETVSYRVHRDDRGRTVDTETIRRRVRRTLLLQREDDLVLAKMVEDKKRSIVEKRWAVAIGAAVLVLAVVLGLSLPSGQLTLRLFDVNVFLPLWVSVAAILSLFYNVSSPVSPELRIPAALTMGKDVTAERWIDLTEMFAKDGADEVPVSEREDLFTRMRAEDRDALFELTRTDPPAFRQLFELMVRQWWVERESIAKEKARLAREEDQRRLQAADALAEKKFTELGFTVPNTPQWQKDQRYSPHD